MGLETITPYPKMFRVDCIKECQGCDGHQTIELRLDPDADKATGHCVQCGKEWFVADKDLKIFEKLIQAEEGQVERDIVLITKHAVFDLVGVKPYPKEYESEKVACEIVRDKLAEKIMAASKQYEIIEPYMPLIVLVSRAVEKALKASPVSFEPVRLTMTRVVNAHIDATKFLADLDGLESERTKFLEEQVKEIASKL